MLGSLLDTLGKRISVIELFLNVWEIREDAYTNPGSALEQEFTSLGVSPVHTREERIFRHCTVINDLYSTYEWFVESALAFWLFRIPRYFKYSELTSELHNAYRHRMSRLIRDIERRRYRHLTLELILEKYLMSLKDDGHWEFVHEALTSHETNLRRKELEQLFGSVGVTNVWRSLEKNASLLAYVSSIDSNETLENLILDLVTYRNDAAHGGPDEILGIDSLRDWIGFVRVLCSALADIITHRVIQCEADSSPLSVIGIVTERYHDNVVVAKCQHGHLRVGQQLYFLKPNSCMQATIESLQLNDNDVQEVPITGEEVEVGLKTSCLVAKNSKIVLFQDE